MCNSRKALKLSGLFMACLALAYGLSLYQGYRNETWAIFFMPVELPPLIFGSAVALWTLTLLVIHLAKKRNAIYLVGAFGIQVSCLLAVSYAPPVAAFGYGFRVMVRQTVGQGELVDYARLCRKLLGEVGGEVPGPGRVMDFQESKHLALWQELTKEEDIGKLGDSYVVRVRENTVSLTWGGAITGHWGLRIYDRDSLPQCGFAECVYDRVQYVGP